MESCPRIPIRRAFYYNRLGLFMVAEDGVMVLKDWGAKRSDWVRSSRIDNRMCITRIESACFFNFIRHNTNDIPQAFERSDFVGANKVN